MTSGVSQIGGGLATGSLLQQAQQKLASVYETFRIVLTDILPTNLTCLVPNALSWAYRSLWSGSISSCPLQNTTGKVAHFFIHGGRLPRADHCTPAILLLHGDHSHPFTMLHLGDIAQNEGRAVFSVSLPYDDKNPENHRSLLRKSIDMITATIAARGGTLGHLLVAGHSRGALEGADAAYVDNNQKINGVIAVAGRFKVITPSERPCRESLKPSVNAVWERLRNPNEGLRVPFYQIAASKDWCMDPEASVVRQDYDHRYVNAGHLGVINHPDTLDQFKRWVAI